MKTLEAAELAEQFGKFLEHVHSRQESFEIVKQGVPYVRLIPATEHACNSHELADQLSAVELSATDRRVLAAAVRSGRNSLKPGKNPWA